MKIGIFTSILDDPLTGIGNYTHNMVENLIKIDKKNDYIFIHSKKNSNRIYQNVNERFIPEISLIPQTFIKSMYATIQKSFDIIHEPAQLGFLFSTVSRNIVTIHDITPILFPETYRSTKVYFYKYTMLRTIKNTDRIIADSCSTKQDLIRHLKVPAGKIKVIHLAVNEKYLHIDIKGLIKIKQKYNLNFPFILYVGTLEPRKNISLLIRGFCKLKKIGLKHRLVIVGRRGWKYSDIFKLIDRLNLKNDVIFTGYALDEDLPYLYRAADLFVYPSLYEGFGLPPLEAMACGTPVITSNTSSLPEVVGDAGIMIDPYNVDELIKAMYDVLTNDGLREEMIKKGLERARMFSWEKTAKETLEIYESVTNTR